MSWYDKPPSVAGHRGPYTWWRHLMEIFSALLAICAGNSPVPGEFPTQRPVTQSFDVFFDLRLNKWLSKQWWGWWFETPSYPLWRHCNDLGCYRCMVMWFQLSVNCHTHRYIVMTIRRQISYTERNQTSVDFATFRCFEFCNANRILHEMIYVTWES